MASTSKIDPSSISAQGREGTSTAGPLPAQGKMQHRWCPPFAWDADFMGLRSLWQRLRHVPAPVADAGLAVVLAVAITIAIPVAPLQSRRPDALAYALGLTIAALVLVRRRWPLAVLLASAATLQVYYQLGYPGIFPAVPLSVALATAWAAGHRGWSLLVAVFYVGGPVVYRDVGGSPATSR